MQEPAPRLPTTRAAVTALRKTAAARGPTVTVAHDIGADRTSRRTPSPPPTPTDPRPTGHASNPPDHPGSPCGSSPKATR